MLALNRILHDETGQALVEYSLIISLVIIFVISSVILFGESLFNLYSTIKDDVDNYNR